MGKTGANWHAFESMPVVRMVGRNSGGEGRVRGWVSVICVRVFDHVTRPLCESGVDGDDGVDDEDVFVFVFVFDTHTNAQ